MAKYTKLRSLANVTAIGIVTLGTTAALATDWNTVPLIQHSEFQSVNADGSNAYDGTFPIRLRGVVLNNYETWLDPTPAYDPGVHLWEMGGEWEIYVAAVDLPGEEDDGDFGATCCWMGQNYGNHIMHQDPWFSYSDAEFLAELDRINYDGETLIRKGDLVEVRARGGLNYQGKMNVNEQHSTDPIYDFEIVILQQGYGLPTPPAVELSELKDSSNAFYFDPTRATGAEYYQGTRIELQNVAFVSTTTWGNSGILTAEDTAGRNIPVDLGRLNFDKYLAPTGTFDVAGIVNQKSTTGTDSYRLIVCEPEDFSPALRKRGDTNCDGMIDVFDIDPFVAALVDTAQYSVDYPNCDLQTADINGDNIVDVFDIDPFVEALVNTGK